ncbi:MAG TPA: DUF881 domain-containing protein [Candidatus Limnocylindrales bacterium]|nr:DUF881 domain-containing protein [Candidatus Limnocylindrales bacterium]
MPAIRPRQRWTITLVAAILGVLVVAQLRSQAANPGLSNLSAQELTLVITNLSTRNEGLRAEVAALERRVASLTDAHDRGESALGELRADLAALEAWAGLTPVIGQGVSIRVSGQIGGEGIEDLLNELRNAGAEAIAVEDVRVVPGTVVYGEPGALSVENTALADGFEIRAIGSPQILTGTLTRGGGVIAQLEATSEDVTISVTPLDAVSIPATERNLVPAHGTPSL